MQTLRHVPTHFAGVFIYRLERGEYQLLVIDSEPIEGAELPEWEDGEKKTKVIGGTNEEDPSEKEEETLQRETLEESGLRLKDGVDPELACTEPHRRHVKYFYLHPIADFEGELREESIDDGQYRLSKPYWVNARDAKGVLYKSHHKALEWVLFYLGIK